MDYIKPEVKNKYNEIYNYLLNNKYIPERLEYKDKLKYKTTQKKGQLLENRLTIITVLIIKDYASNIG